MSDPRPRFFRSPAEFRRWLEAHHARATELWVGFHKRATGRPSMTWPESVDEALCFGWIDAIRRSLGPDSYAIRFTRRKPTSTWSRVNVRRGRALIRAGRMRPAGRAAFDARRPERVGVYSFEQRPQTLPPRYAAMFRRHPEAWAHYRSRPPWYRRTTCWWVVSAKQEETRLRRLRRLIEDSAHQRAIPQLDRTPGAGGATKRAPRRRTPPPRRRAPKP